MSSINDIWGYLHPKLRGTHWRPLTIVGPPEFSNINVAFFFTSLLINEFGEAT